MVRHPGAEVAEASKKLVCVRVNDMKGVNLSVYRFDYDLTFAVLFMNPNGVIYHRYGNRTPAGPDSHLSMTSLAAVMRGAHTAHEQSKSAEIQDLPFLEPPRAVEELPTMARRVKQGKAPDCFHCHMVNQAIDEQAIEEGTFSADVAWRWPPSTRMGLTLARDDQQLISAVADDSPAGVAGVRVGDRLTHVRAAPVLTEGDVQRQLDSLSSGAKRLPITLQRDGAALQTFLELPDGWRVGSPEELWRSTMWRLSPKPGFGGKPINAAQKKSLGIGEDVGAFRVTYIVTWGPNARTGRNAAKAGIRNGDVVVSVAGKADFRDQMHFHAWFRLTQKVGETVPVVVLRKGERKTFELPVIE